jgi:hypothetical protein
MAMMGSLFSIGFAGASVISLIFSSYGCLFRCDVDGPYPATAIPTSQPIDAKPP